MRRGKPFFVHDSLSQQCTNLNRVPKYFATCVIYLLHNKLIKNSSVMIVTFHNKRLQLVLASLYLTSNNEYLLKCDFIHVCL